MQVGRRRVLPSLAATLKSRTAGRTYFAALAFFLTLLCLGSASACPYFQTPDSTGNCVCAVNGNPPDVNGSCPIPQLCVSTQTCCAPGQLTNTGACCPQGQMPFTDGSCITMNQLIAKTMANDGLCPLQYQTYQSNGTCLYSPRTPGYGTACTISPPLPIPSYGRPGGGPVIEELPCCMPGQLPATSSYSPSPNDPPYLLYTGTCCPVGQVPQPNGNCLPAQSFISTCPGGGAFNAQTNSCCPPGNSITNKYVCCPPNQSPQGDGSCGCPPAQVQQFDGSCLPLCNANSIPSPIGDTCTYCPPGQIGTSQGVCCAPNQATTNGFCCPAGWNPQGTACNRPPMWRAAPNTRCSAGGLVPREAFAGDTVCVELRVHDQAIADNIAAPSRTLPNGLCVRGYLWRRANPGDHVCVLPETRAETQSDNQRATARVQQPPTAAPQQAPSGGAGATAGSVQPSCPPNSVLTSGITGPGAICLLKSITCPTGAAISVLSDGSGQACCPSGTTFLAAENACWSQQQGKVPTMPFTCPPGWTLDSVVPNAPGASVCLQTPTCPSRLLLSGTTCQPPVPPREQPGREGLVAQPNAPIVCVFPSELRDGRCVTLSRPRAVPLRGRVSRPGIVAHRPGRAWIGRSTGQTTTIRRPSSGQRFTNRPASRAPAFRRR